MLGFTLQTELIG